MPAKGSKRPLSDRFWNKVAKTSSCWNWAGANTSGPSSYGQIWDGERYVLAHRASWIIHNGSIPDGLMVLHHCDNSRCVRPDHLYVGTQKENMRDRGRRGRMNRGNRKLTDEQVEQIRNADGLVKDIAVQFGVSRQAISAIRNGIRHTGPRRGNGRGESEADLNILQVADIKRSARQQREIAEKYGISQSMVSNIKNGRSWRKV